MTANAKQVQERYGLINEAEGALALRYASDGDLDAAVKRVISERVAPYNQPDVMGEAAASVSSEPEPVAEAEGEAENPLVEDLTEVGEPEPVAEAEGEAAPEPGKRGRA